MLNKVLGCSKLALLCLCAGRLTDSRVIAITTIGRATATAAFTGRAWLATDVIGGVVTYAYVGRVCAILLTAAIRAACHIGGWLLAGLAGDREGRGGGALVAGRAVRASRGALS